MALRRQAIHVPSIVDRFSCRVYLEKRCAAGDQQGKRCDQIVHVTPRLWFEAIRFLTAAPPSAGQSRLELKV